MDDEALYRATTAIEQAPALEVVRELAAAAFHASGICRVVYHHVPPMGHPDGEAVQVATEGFPEDIVAKYVSKQLYRQNSAFLGALASTRPAAGSTYGPLDSDDPEAQAIFAEARKLVPGEWLVIPVFGPSARNGTFGLVFDGDVPQVNSPVVRRLGEFCQAIHLRVCDLIEATQARPPVLSGRETTVLGWVARGKSNGDIATILDISPRTVDAHLSRVYLKLGVSDRVSAAIRGVGYGYILRVKT